MKKDNKTTSQQVCSLILTKDAAKIIAASLVIDEIEVLNRSNISF